MEIIKKQILLEPYYSRHCSLIPFLVEETGEVIGEDIGYVDITQFNVNINDFLPSGNWGKIVYDIDLSKCKTFKPSLFNGLVIPRNLSKFLGGERVSFTVLSNTYRTIRDKFDKIPYYKAITKKGKKEWVKVDINLVEKLNKRIVYRLPDLTLNETLLNGDFEVTESSNFEISVGYTEDENGLYRFDEPIFFEGKEIGSLVYDALEIDEKIVYWGYENNCLTLYGLGKAVDENTGDDVYDENNNLVYDDNTIVDNRWVYRGVITVDGEQYDKWEDVADTNPNYSLTKRIVKRVVINETILGVYNNDVYQYQEFIKLFCFLLRAMGMFIVDPSYIKNDNGVPEIMYYTSIKPYIEEMLKSKGNENCCRIKNYNFLGGEEFYHYLFFKQNEIGSEINYWVNSLYKEDYPYINMSIAINGEYNTIGLYSIITENEDNVDDVNRSGVMREINGESPLIYLKRNKITYATMIKNGVETTVELPMILDESVVDNNSVVTKYKLTYPYEYKIPKNLTNAGSGYYYGDMIYRMDFVDDDKTGETGVVNIYYVIGGKLDFKNKQYLYVDNKEPSIPSFNNFVRNWQIYNNIDIDVYLYLKNEFSKESNYNEEIIYQGEVDNESLIKKDNIGTEKVWVYKIMYSGILKNNKCFIGDYVIVDNGTIYHFGVDKIKNTSFSGIRFFEQKKWKKYSFKKSQYQINMLLDNYRIPWNILQTDYVENSDNVKLIDFAETTNIVNGIFFSYNSIDNENENAILLEQDFGKIDVMVENSSDIIFDRGNVTSFELHYKLSEINTMEDMVNYGNNFFGL